MVYTKNRVKLLLFYDIQKGFSQKNILAQYLLQSCGDMEQIRIFAKHRFIITNNKITVNGE